MEFKLRRWILAEKNLTPESIKECNLVLKYKLSQSFLEEKGYFFNEIDRKLFFGIGFHMLA